MAVRTRIRWAVLHGAPRAFLAMQTHRGQQLARLLVGPQRGGDPYQLIAEIRASGPLIRAPFASMTADYQLCRTILRDNRFGATNPTNMNLPRSVLWLLRSTDPQLSNPVEPPSMLQVDPPDHTRHRRAVAQAFTPRAINMLRQRVTEVTNQLLDRMESISRPDLIADFAAPLPVAIIAEVLGVPEEARPRLLDLGDNGAPLLEIGLPWKKFQRGMEALREGDRYFEDHIARLRAEPGDDIFSQVIHSGELTQRELGATASLLIGAGFETTVNLIGNAIVQLWRHPDQLAMLREDPALWPNAVEEVLRFESPVQLTSRTALCDLEVAGHRFEAGETVALLLAAANRDPGVFADPDRFDITRPSAKDHLSFSSGIHACLGASLARMEATVALHSLFERFPGLRLDGPPTPRELVVLRGFRRIPALTAMTPSTVSAR